MTPTATRPATRLLIAVGQRLRGAIRDGDMAARLGGDEFVIALPGVHRSRGRDRVARRVLAALASRSTSADRA